MSLTIHFAGFWFIKFGTWTSLLVASFYLDFDDIQRFGDVTRFGAGLFLAIQMILILDLIYTVNEKLLDQENPAWQGVMITLTGVLYAFSFAGTGVAYWYYVKQHSGCGLNIFFITMNLFLGLVNTVLSLLPKRNERAGLLTAGMTFGYTTWLLISGLAAENGSMLQECHRGDASQGWITASGFILSMAVVIYGVVGVTSRSHKLIISQNESIDEVSAAERLGLLAFVPLSLVSPSSSYPPFSIPRFRRRISCPTARICSTSCSCWQV